jgi:hypothetical protein
LEAFAFYLFLEIKRAIDEEINSLLTEKIDNVEVDVTKFRLYCGSDVDVSVKIHKKDAKTITMNDVLKENGWLTKNPEDIIPLISVELHKKN